MTTTTTKPGTVFYYIEGHGQLRRCTFVESMGKIIGIETWAVIPDGEDAISISREQLYPTPMKAWIKFAQETGRMVEKAKQATIDNERLLEACCERANNIACGIEIATTGERKEE